ncbi:MAG: hypothetical protein DYH12_20450, partial [Sorangiineae bacterium PRO1]|nr:hypothetical protein [Sorangiineae bacterium PRO1]
MTKMRVYEIARDLGMENKALVALLQSIGVSDVRNHMSVVGPDAVERVRRHLEKQAAPKAAEERIRPTVVKRRAPARPAGEVKVTDVGVDTLRSSPVAASSPRAADVVLKSAPQAAPPP